MVTFLPCSLNSCISSESEPESTRLGEGKGLQAPCSCVHDVVVVHMRALLGESMLTFHEIFRGFSQKLMSLPDSVYVWLPLSTSLPLNFFFFFSFLSLSLGSDRQVKLMRFIGGAPGIPFKCPNSQN